MPKTSHSNNEDKKDGGFKKGKASPESPKFFIYNHGYINLAVVLVILTLFLFPPTRHFVHKLVIPQYRETIVFPGENHDHKLYRNGMDDLSTIFFYTLVWYVIHYTVQDKVAAPIQSRLKISEERHAKFTESFLLYLFGLYSIFHEIYIFCKIGVFEDFTLLWKGYPDTHRYLPLSVKMFFILQIAYWLHKIPELFFQNLTKEEKASRASYAFFFLGLTSFSYFTNFYRLGMAIYFIELISQLMFHKSRLMYYAGYTTFSTFIYRFWILFYIPIRISEMAVGIYVLWYGLRKKEVHSIDLKDGNFNTPLISFGTILSIIAVQCYMLHNLYKVISSKNSKNGQMLAFEGAGISYRKA